MYHAKGSTSIDYLSFDKKTAWEKTSSNVLAKGTAHSVTAELRLYTNMMAYVWWPKFFSSLPLLKTSTNTQRSNFLKSVLQCGTLKRVNICVASVHRCPTMQIIILQASHDYTKGMANSCTTLRSYHPNLGGQTSRYDSLVSVQQEELT